MSEFVHLHLHTPFSFLDGATPIDSLVHRAAEFDLPALAVTDHNNVSAAVRFYKAAQKAGIKPIQGAEVTLENGYHLVLLAQNPAGYANLCQLLTAAHAAGDRQDPRLPFTALARYHENLIALSGCRRGEIPSLLLQGNRDAARRAAYRYIDYLGRENFYLELICDFLPHTYWLNQALTELAGELGVKTVATNNVHYGTKADFPLHDTLTCIRTLTSVDEVHRDRRLNAENYLKSPTEMKRLFAGFPGAIETTLEIADRCEPALDPGQQLFPAFPVPEGITAADYLRHLTWEGAQQRYGTITSPIRERIEHELSIITQLGVEDYFLAVWDIARFAREKGIRYAGRGSAADSAVVYCLQITDVDSIARGLLFERFLSLERAQKPDIDIDFDARYRDIVADYVYKKYGKEKVASVCTFNTFRARSAIRDFGKALGFPLAEIDTLAKRFPHIPADAIRQAVHKFPEIRDSHLPQWKYEQLFQLCEQAAGLPRFYGTHLGGLVICRKPLTQVTPLQPAAKGVLITQFDKDDIEDLGLIKLDLLSLRTLSVVEDTMRSLHESPQPKKVAESKNEICQEAPIPGYLGSITGKVQIPRYEEIPLDDTATYRRLNSGQTIGAFQLESPAQRALQARLGANNIEDIVASVALIRPGPIKGDMVEPFIARRHGQEEPAYIHPALKPILEKTYGVVLYQEQVIEIATAIAGFTPGESDRLRRVMTHFRSQKEMEAIGKEFIAKAVANGVKPDVAKTIFSYIVGYAGYGFCEAHAAAFGNTAYKTAYLLEHYPAHFYAAILSHQPMGFYSANTICLEARRRGIPILRPDINRSEARFTVEEIENFADGEIGLTQEISDRAGESLGTRSVRDFANTGKLEKSPNSTNTKRQSSPRKSQARKAIRVSLAQVQNMDTASLEKILAGRKNRPYQSLQDFCQRLHLKRDIVVNLILCGAFDGLHPNRRQLLWELGEIQASLTRFRQPSLFSGELCRKQQVTDLDSQMPDSRIPDNTRIPDFTAWEKFIHEYSVLGFSAGTHIMAFFRRQLQKRRILSSRDLSRCQPGQTVTAAGIVIRPHRPPTKSGRIVVFLTLEDEFGLIDVTIFEDVYQRYGHIIFTEPALIVRGKLEQRGNARSITAWKVEGLPLSTTHN